MAPLSLFQLSLLYLVPSVSATCYYPDGTIETNPEFQPCVATVGTFSMCCATNRAQFPDQCLPNGLCHNPCATSGLCGDSTGGQYWRESCTDPTWSSPYCLKNLCADSAQNAASSNGTAAVSLCVADGKWCCGGNLNSTECCASNVVRVAIAATVGVSSTIPTSTSSSTSTNKPTMTDTVPSVSSSATNLATSNNAKGVKIGVGVGVGATCVVVAAIIVYMVWRRRKAGKGGKGEFGVVPSGDTQVNYSLKDMPKVELDNEAHDRSKVELDARAHEIYEADAEDHYKPSSGKVAYHELGA